MVDVGGAIEKHEKDQQRTSKRVDSIGLLFYSVARYYVRLCGILAVIHALRL
jgi:hypothetical protein